MTGSTKDSGVCRRSRWIIGSRADGSEELGEAQSDIRNWYRPDIFDVNRMPLKHIFLVPPEMARNFERLGFTSQESLRDYIYEKTCVPYEQLSPEEMRGIQEKIKISIAGEGSYANRLPPDRIPVFQEALKPGGRVPVLITPEDIHFIVVGYPVGGSVVEATYHRAPYKWVGHKTKLISGATLTMAGR